MILLNFSHPLTAEHRAAIENLAHNPLEQVIELPVHFDQQQAFLPQLQALIARVELSPQAWQTAAILVNLPSYNYISALLLAELHGRMGYFPPVIRMKPVENALPPRFEVAEIINLQAIRDAARKERF